MEQKSPKKDWLTEAIGGIVVMFVFVIVVAAIMPMAEEFEAILYVAKAITLVIFGLGLYTAYAAFRHILAHRKPSQNPN